MRRMSKSVFFIVALLIVAITGLSFFGVSTTYGDVSKTYIKGADDIRWGIDIRGGVDVTFGPPEGVDATDEEMAAAESIIKVRLVSQNITDYEVYTDYGKDRIIVRFPWKSDETDFNPEEAIKELGATAALTFREGLEVDQTTGLPTGVTASNVILEGKDVKKAEAVVSTDPSSSGQYMVSLELNEEGAQKFKDATTRLAETRGVISIWMDDTLISAPTVTVAIPDGKATITSSTFTAQSAKDLADKINAGALPFKLETENYNSISPTLGAGARDAMVLAGAIAFVLVVAFMIIVYRLPGCIAGISLLGQLGLMIASITGFFAAFPSFTLTVPGIAGIILSIGMGVDANIITASRIKEEIRKGKTIDGAVSQGYQKAFSAILDGNVTVVIVAIILMGSFGPPSSIFAKLLTPLFAWFGPSTAGTIYSFGYTLLVGTILNLVMGVFASRLMLTSISKFKGLRKPWLYGGAKNENL